MHIYQNASLQTLELENILQQVNVEMEQLTISLMRSGSNDRRSSPGVRFSKIPKIVWARKLSGLFSGAFLGISERLIFLPIFSGIFSGFVAQTVARA